MSHAKTKHDYFASYHTYKIVKESTRMSLQEFCEDQNLSYDYTRRKFAEIRKDLKKATKNPKAPKAQGKRTRTKHDWDAYRIEYLKGDFKSLSEFLRTKGIKPNTGFVAKQTKTWIEEKAKIQEQKRQKINNQILEEQKRKRFGELEGRVLARLYAGMDAFETIQRFQARYSMLADEVEAEEDDEKNKFRIMSLMDPKGLKEFASATKVTVDGVHQLFSMIIDFEEAKNSKDLLQKLISGEIDVTEAGLKYAAMGGNLPEAVRILLGKVIPEEPEPPQDAFPSDEELNRLYLEGVARINNEIDHFLPERQKEIEQLKESLKDHDSFADAEALGKG